MKPDLRKKLIITLMKLIITLIFGIILAGAAVLRLYDLGEESLWLDECFTLDYASGSISSLVEKLKVDVHPIGYYLPQHILVNYFGTGEVSLRVLSVFFGILTVFLTYVLARKIFSWKEGLLAALFVAVSYTSIFYSQEAKMYSMFAVFFLLSMISFIRLLEKPSVLNTLFFSVSVALLLYTHIIGLAIFFAYVLYYVTSYILQEKINLIPSFVKEKKFLPSRFYAALVIIFLLYLPWLKILLFYQLPLLYNFLGSKLIEKTGLNLLPIVVISTLLLLLLYLAALYSVIKNKINLNSVKERFRLVSVFFSNEKIVFLLLLSLIVLDFALSKYLFSSVSIIRFVFFLLPLFYITLSRILMRMKSNSIAIVLFILLMISASLELYMYYSFDSKEQFREAADYMEINASPADVLFLHRATIAKVCFDYYYSGNAEEVRLIKAGNDDRLLIKRASGKRDAYLILSHNYHTKDYFKQKLDSLYKFVEEKKFIGVTIYKYEVSES